MAIAYDSSTSGHDTANSGTYTLSLNNVAGTFLCVSMFTNGSPTITAFTYAGIPLVAFPSSNPVNTNFRFFYLRLPATGTNNLVLTYTGSSNSISISAVTYSGADIIGQQNAVNHRGNTNNWTETVTDTITGTISVMLIGSIRASLGGTGTTQRVVISSAGNYNCAIGDDIGNVANPHSLNFTSSGTDDVSDIVFTLIPSNSYFSDNFNRADSGAVGNSWSESDTSSVLSITSNKLHMSSTVDTAPYIYRTASSHNSNIKITATITVTTASSAGSFTLGSLADGTKFGNCFGVLIGVRNGSSTVYRVDQDTNNSLGSFTFANGSTYYVELIINTDYSREIRIWNITGSRPSSATFSDTARTPTSAGTNWQLGYDSGGTSTFVYENGLFQVDNLSTSTDYPLTASQASFTLTGENNLFHRTANMLSSYATFVLTGEDTLFALGHGISAIYAQFTLNGQDSLLHRGIRIISDYTSFTLTGESSLFSKGFRLAVDYASFVVTGFADRFPIYWRNATKHSVSVRNIKKTNV